MKKIRNTCGVLCLAFSAVAYSHGMENDAPDVGSQTTSDTTLDALNVKNLPEAVKQQLMNPIDGIGVEMLDPSVPPTDQRSWRHLNHKEKVFVKRIFQDTVDLSDVKIVRHKSDEAQPGIYAYVIPDTMTSVAPDGNIHVGANFYCADFSATACDYKTRSKFLHEMVHIYQLQSGHRFHKDSNYDYAQDLAGAKGLKGLSDEGAAALVQDYYELCLMAKPEVSADDMTRRVLCSLSDSFGNTIAKSVHAEFKIPADTMPPVKPLTIK